MFGRVKLDNTLLTCDKDNFNQVTARSRKRTLVTVVRDMCTTTVSPAPPHYNVKCIVSAVKGNPYQMFSFEKEMKILNGNITTSWETIKNFAMYAVAN